MKLLEKNEILVLVPMKGVQASKSRLRQSFSTEIQPLISELVHNLFVNTISSLKAAKVDYAVVSPSESILDLAKKHKSSFTFKDAGKDLNLALHLAIEHIFHLNKWKFVFILTADLPFLVKESLEKIFSFFSDSNLTILPAPLKNDGTRGTSGLFLPVNIACNLNFCFGHNSFFKFIQLFEKLGLTSHSWNIYNKNQMGFDLDDFSDLVQVLKEMSDSKLIPKNLYVMIS